VSRTLRRMLLPLGAAAMLLAVSAPAMAGGVVDPGPIAPNQSFTGLVNGVGGESRIAVVCDGPIDFVPTGHPAAGQFVSAAQTSAPAPGDGFTGAAGKAIDVGLGTSATTAPVRLRFYQATAAIPTDTLVPCSGTGVVSFMPAPTSATARTGIVKVTFVPQV
jgi:hypothetical protein